MEEKSFDGLGIIKIFGKCLIIEVIISAVGMFILALVLSNTSVKNERNNLWSFTRNIIYDYNIFNF